MSDPPPGPGLALGAFFEGVRRGQPSVQRCAACGELAVPPKVYCPSCRGAVWTVVPLAGDGEVTSYTVIRVPPAAMAPEAPYAIAVVRMSEGVSLLGRLEGVAVHHLRIGLPVRLVAPANPAANPPVITFGPR